MPSEGQGILPGAASRMSATLMDVLSKQAQLIGKGEWDILKKQREMEGEVHPLIPNPTTPIDNLINAIGGLPGAVLGNIRTPVKIAMRLAFLKEEAYRAAMKDATLDPKLTGDAFEARHQLHFENPSEEMLKSATSTPTPGPSRRTWTASSARCRRRCAATTPLDSSSRRSLAWRRTDRPWPEAQSCDGHALEVLPRRPVLR